ncbi:PEPKR2 [Symbiodinium sp. CCMP2592]|nr:PEPKR2 [Symbiodinium sp. CCMP2592]
MFAPVHTKLASPFSRVPDATHIILIAPRASGRANPVVWLLCTRAYSDYSLDHLIMSLSRRGAVRWDCAQCLHLAAGSLGQGSHVTVFGGMSLLPLHEEHRVVVASKADVLNMSKVHNFEREAVKIWDKLDSAMVRREVGFLQQSAGHPNISALLGVYAEAQKSSVTWLLAMEHCAEGDLFNIMKAKSLPVGLILGIQAGLSSALTHLHYLHIVHRDVKAENVVMHKDRAVLIDFGIAAYRNDRQAMFQSVGSPGYAAPEMIAPIMLCYDELVDVFALGVLSYFMMFRALPFRGNTHAETLEKTRNCQVEIPDLNDDGLRPVLSLVLRMMSKEAIDRPRAMVCFKELTILESLVTEGGKSRAVRIAHAALMHYGYLDTPGECCLEEFCGKAEQDTSEEALPRAGAAGSLTARAGRILTSARMRIRTMPAPLPPRVRQTVSKALRSMCRSSNTKVSKAPREPENGTDFHCPSRAFGLPPSGDAEADPAESIGAPQKAKDALPGKVVSNSSNLAEEAVKHGGGTAAIAGCRSTVIVTDTQNDQESKQEHADILLDFPLSARVGKLPLHEDLDDMFSDHPLPLVATRRLQDHGRASPDCPVAVGASWHHPSAGHDAINAQKMFNEPQEVLPREADPFEFAPIVSGDLE